MFIGGPHGVLIGGMGGMPMGGVLMGGMPMGGMPMGGMLMGGMPMGGIVIVGTPICKYCGEVFDSSAECQRSSDAHDPSCPRFSGGGTRRPSSASTTSRGHATSNTRTLFHQTDRAAAQAIIREQRFSRGDAGLAGGGIYFAESASETQAKAKKHGTVLAADVSLGRIKHIHGGDSSITYSSLQSEGYDSVCILGRSSGKEYVVYNYGQVNNIREY